MNNIVQRITSDSQEVKQTTDVLQQAKATRQQRHPNTQANLKTPTKEEPNLRHKLSQTGPSLEYSFRQYSLSTWQ